MTRMKIAKWGNSLAMRIPADVVRELGLTEGGTVEVNALSGGRLELRKDDRRTIWLTKIDAMARPLPTGYKFDRDEANER